MEVVSGASAVQSLLGVVAGLVHAILEAREAVREAPLKTQLLVAKVESSQKCLSQLRGDRPLPDVLKPLVSRLANELVQALEKLQKFMDSDERRQCSNQALAAATSFLGRGATKQNKKTLAIIEGLENILKEIDRHVLYGIYDAAIATGTKDSSAAVPVPSTRNVPDLVAWMSTLADQNQEGLRLVIQLCESNSKTWYDPSKTAKRGRGPRVNVAVKALADLTRAAREGGYEVPHSTKVMFTLSVDFDRWCFYVLTYDRWEDATPQVFFPKSGININNWVSCNSKMPRKFPNRSQSQPGDPVSLKVERSRHTPDDEAGHLSIFLVLSTTPLHTEGAEQITIQDIEQHMVPAKNELMVKHLLFDISKQK